MEKLLRAEDSVARVAETGADIGVLVELSVEVADVELDVGMRLHQRADALGSGDDGHELDLSAAVLLDEVYRCNS